MKIEIGITRKNTQEVAYKLTKIPADEYVLYTRTRNAHWNITGPDFYDKHKFFETQFEQLDQFIDDVAERVRLLGHYAPAALRSFLELTQLTEMTSEKNDSHVYIKELLSDHESIIISLRKNIHPFAVDQKDAGTSDFITGLMGKHEKMVWFLRSRIH